MYLNDFLEIFKTPSKKRFLKTLQIHPKFFGNGECTTSVALFDNKLKVFHGFN